MPQPEGPTTTANSPRSSDKLDAVERPEGAGAARVELGDVAQLDPGHRSLQLTESHGAPERRSSAPANRWAKTAVRGCSGGGRAWHVARPSTVESAAMNRYPVLAVVRPIALLLAFAAPGLAQHGVPSGPSVPRPSFKAPPEAKQYDFLIGQWDLVVEVPAQSLAARIHGVPKLVGTWKAWRGLDGWGIEDELRITDEAGNPVALSAATRVWDAAASRWTYTVLDVYRARFSAGTAEWRGGEMLLSSTGTDPDGRPSRSRTRIHEIKPDSFRFQQDRSADDGKTWTEGTLRITAKRVGATAPR